MTMIYIIQNKVSQISSSKTVLHQPEGQDPEHFPFHETYPPICMRYSVSFIVEKSIPSSKLRIPSLHISRAMAQLVL